jgi:hypothetical protein
MRLWADFELPPWCAPRPSPRLDHTARAPPSGRGGAGERPPDRQGAVARCRRGWCVVEPPSSRVSARQAGAAGRSGGAVRRGRCGRARRRRCVRVVVAERRRVRARAHPSSECGKSPATCCGSHHGSRSRCDSQRAAVPTRRRGSRGAPGTTRNALRTPKSCAGGIAQYDERGFRDQLRSKKSLLLC